MTYNSRNIKKHKGKLIRLFYKNKFKDPCDVIGEITASTRFHIIFHVNKDSQEITLEYSQIEDILKPEKE